MPKYETIIGLEIHLQLKTKSKMFCSCSNDGENQPPNTTICPVCLGHPGTLPTVNEEAVKQGLSLALALHCQINQQSKFDRKNYFYPDLPKGYQISQFDVPLAHDGYLIIKTDHQKKRIRLERVHLEEDAAKNIHQGNKTLVDFNRGGTPLAEIVTRPDFDQPTEAKQFLQQLRLIARYLGVSDADMEKGQLRCDANISLRPQGDQKLYPKTEIKNLNSFKAVEKALEFERQRQEKLWEQKKPPQLTSTRGWDENRGETVEQRTKESFADYRYFPEPDLPPLVIKESLINQAQSLMPELPLEREERFIKEYGLLPPDAEVLIKQKNWADYYEAVMSDFRAWLFKANGLSEVSEQAAQLWQKHKAFLAKLAVNWITTEVFRLISKDFKWNDFKITAENMAEFLSLIYQKKINSSAAQTILKQMFASGDDPSNIAEKLDLAQIDDVSTLEDLATKVIMMHPDQAKQYRSGKEALIKFFVGKLMQESKGRANPLAAEEILRKKIK
ncbi:MAG: Asp-tRNA(Asn)/Glu-tRNA(Gln) amidotransferase GatCAB subunit B [Candidatus Komeilibacteria bacterium CG11_big_fil_rev_8_21_14_0_20_36_20]|uniref:Aspartyl/glutamyl-tRNA(Asn/Gln) amidotransferase subunit B n=1 Tax=Candidatus Komeilibacteria bacterium CG11_big_fil_rev_8_21_14_0_20_36_20 TaxID=1974477 RepID=A0A2H0NAX5_9BACT|nr:MAG: Asp-tRNA(Asn)/Glu-tRNA(Gln) amidotransferase GatCAB subunit B [Candidatus Komeilibacteria bacterium CG11_big_fil_rev_8_21_14_0_20_36_20]PIR82038.1 MAG: Asp-tRNA(Asn)/Glu-tRNA(Gln) amidotransferase subunit GatB [Candidatus Komeilibacteria bacterium CG10_big_fil_rev_8_21_14_0_10_36_65]PJC55017.1 MAG: Asp-tRNA(Asn)/Glu-tRNA(Gln) amidotransferase subunit GatB [Candidatus Komeilibacteria bacterium CG_4_9_14_0_2_um_filter_36_13]